MKTFIQLLFLCVLTASGAVFGQGRVVEGVVSDAEGNLPGVTVYEKGQTTNGTTTDANGRYRLTLRGKDGVLIFTSIGFKLAEQQTAGRTTLDVKLEASDQTLNEVVVVGYGQQKKVTLTGAVSSVGGREIRENPTASLQNALVGRLPGFFAQQQSGQPGADGALFFIRGVSSYNGNNRPLIIVDDIEFSYDQFARLDPNEIENLSILKDASTTAIYGVRGANGVVVITTRRGKEGPPQISVRGEFGLSQPTILPDYLNAYETARLYNQAQINDNAANPSASFKPRWSQEDLDHFKNGTDPYGHPDINWKEVLFKNFSQQYRGNLDLSGGTQRVKYFVSAGYLNQNGMLKNYGEGQGVDNNYYQQRYNYRSNLDINVTKSLDLRLDLYGNFAQVNTPNAGSPSSKNDLFYDYSSFLTLAPFAYPLYNPDGSLGFSTWIRNENPAYNVNNVVGRLRYLGYRRNNESNMNMIVSAKQKLDFLTPGLSIQGRVAYTSNYFYSRDITRESFPSFIYDPVNKTYEPRDPNVFRLVRFGLTYNGRHTARVLNLQAILNYDRNFGRHHVSGLALLNRNSNTTNSTTGNVAIDDVYRFIPNNFQGYSARLGYEFGQKYLFQFNAAYNGSDRFVGANRFGLFPAVSAGWNISEENFFKNRIKAVDLLKIRGSYGIVGNDALGTGFTYYYQQNYSAGNIAAVGGPAQAADFGYSSNPITGIVEGALANNNVTWEKEKKLDLGLEFGLFNSALSGSVGYFDNNRYDILTTRGTVSTIFGQALPPVNLGKVNNRGYELELGYQNRIGANFSYNIKGNYSFAKNKVVFQDEPTNLYAYQNFTGNSIGQPRLYQWIGYYKDQADIDNSPKPSSRPQPGDLKYADLNGDGLINGFDQSVSGYPNLPNTTFGVNLGARYKNFSFSVLFQGARNFNVAGTAEAIRQFSSNLTAVHQGAWTPEIGDAATFPRLSLLGGISDPLSNNSTFYNISGNFVRLKNAQFSYDLPVGLTKKIGIPQIRVYANGTNLLTFTGLNKLYQLDPEIQSITGPQRDRVSYPPQRLINFGLSATF